MPIGQVSEPRWLQAAETKRGEFAILLLKIISVRETSTFLRFNFDCAVHDALTSEGPRRNSHANSHRRNSDCFEHRHAHRPRSGRLPILSFRQQSGASRAAAYQADALAPRLTSYWKAARERAKGARQGLATQQFRGCQRRTDRLPPDRRGQGSVPNRRRRPRERFPSAMAATIGTTNFKVIPLWVIADTRFDLPPRARCHLLLSRGISN